MKLAIRGNAPMKPRKTIAIETLKEQANYMFKHSRDAAAGERLGYDDMMVRVLHDTGNYHGYVYLTKEDMVDSIAGHSVGINDLGLPYEERFAGTDPTRIRYA